MSEGSTLTIRVASETKAKLERLALQTRQTRDALASDVLTAYADRQLAIIASIEHGLDEIRAGQGLGTDEVFRDVHAAIVEAERNRSGR